MKKLLAGLVVLLVAGAFVGGYWPQRERLVQARAEAAELQRQLSEARAELAGAESRARLDRLFGQYLALEEAVLSGNYGEAQPLSSAFFDQVRTEASGPGDASARAALEAVLIRRDAVTAGIARGDASVREVLVPIERELRRALGYPVPAPAPAKAAAEEGRP